MYCMRRLYNNIQQLETPTRRRASPDAPPAEADPADHGLPVYVMLPLDTVWLLEREGRSASVIKREAALEVALRTLRKVRRFRLYEKHRTVFVQRDQAPWFVSAAHAFPPAPPPAPLRPAPLSTMPLPTRSSAAPVAQANSTSGITTVT